MMVVVLVDVDCLGPPEDRLGNTAAVFSHTKITIQLYASVLNSSFSPVSSKAIDKSVDQ